jgi:hypothetical protein
MVATEKAREARLRRLAKRHGLFLAKSRARDWSIDNQQEYNLHDGYSGHCIEDARYSWTLDQLEDYLQPETD